MPRHATTRTGIAAALALLLGTGTRAGDDPGHVAGLDDPEVGELLAIVESDAFRDPAYCDLKCEALRQLQRLAAAGGDPLVQAAVGRIRSGPADRRARAQLVLAQAPPVPEAVLLPLLAEADPEVSGWAALLLDLRRAADAPGAASFASQDTPEPDPLLDVEDDLAALLPSLVFEGGRAWSRGDPGEERREVRLERVTADVDGDDVAEHCVAGSDEGAFACAVVLERTAADGAWRVAAAESGDFGRQPQADLRDLDGDGAPEFCVDVWHGGTPSWFLTLAYAPEARAFRGSELSYHEVPRVVRVPPATAFVATRIPHRDNYGGTAIHTVGTAAFLWELHRWTPGGFEALGTATTPFDE